MAYRQKNNNAARVQNVIVPVRADPTLTWDEYHAPRSMKEGLEMISKRVDPEWQKKRCAVDKQARGGRVDPFPGRQILLLHGPPGTGKTHAMRMLATLCKLQPYQLDIRAITEANDARTLWKDVLDTIGGGRDSIFFLDECENIFRDRGPLMGGYNCMSQITVQLIDDFLAWCEGLEKPSLNAEDARVIICLSTNVVDNLDRAVVSRCSPVEVPLPGEAELFGWWKQETQHLKEPDHRTLASQSVFASLSFRDVKKIVKDQHDKAASRMEPAEEMTCAKYAWAIKRFRGLCLEPGGDVIGEISESPLPYDMDSINSSGVDHPKIVPPALRSSSSSSDVAQMLSFLEHDVLPYMQKLAQQLHDEQRERRKLERKVEYLEQTLEEDWCMEQLSLEEQRHVSKTVLLKTGVGITSASFGGRFLRRLGSSLQ